MAATATSFRLRGDHTHFPTPCRVPVLPGPAPLRAVSRAAGGHVASDRQARRRAFSVPTVVPEVPHLRWQGVFPGPRARDPALVALVLGLAGCSPAWAEPGAGRCGTSLGGALGCGGGGVARRTPAYVGRTGLPVTGNPIDSPVLMDSGLGDAPAVQAPPVRLSVCLPPGFSLCLRPGAQCHIRAPSRKAVGESTL